MNIVKTLALVSEGLAIAGPLLERFGLENASVTKAVLEGIRELTDLAQFAIGGLEDVEAEVEDLITEFRTLKQQGGITGEDLENMASSIEAKTAALKTAVHMPR